MSSVHPISRTLGSGALPACGAPAGPNYLQPSGQKETTFCPQRDLKCPLQPKAG